MMVYDGVERIMAVESVIQLKVVIAYLYLKLSCVFN